MKEAWIINYSEEFSPEIALSREGAYKQAKSYVENMDLEPGTEYYRSIDLKDLEASYKKTCNDDFGSLYVNVKKVHCYE